MNSKINSISPQKWGKPTWDTLFYVALAYPDNPNNEDKQNMRLFILSYGKVIPCEKCRYNFPKHVNKFPLTDSALNNRYNLVNWLINIHNEICIMNNKKCITYEEILNKYLLDNESYNYKYNYTLFIIILIISFIILLKLYKKN